MGLPIPSCIIIRQVKSPVPLNCRQLRLCKERSDEAIYHKSNDQLDCFGPKGLAMTRASSSGFTIIELVLVIVLAGIMAIIAIPRFSSMNTYRSRVFYDEVLNSLRYARKLAVGKNLHIQVDIAASSITLRQRTEGTNCTTGATFAALIDPETNASPYVKTAPAGITLSPVISLYFDGLGSAYLVSGIATTCPIISTSTINVTGSTLSETITITGATGFVQGSI